MPGMWRPMMSIQAPTVGAATETMLDLEGAVVRDGLLDARSQPVVHVHTPHGVWGERSPTGRTRTLLHRATGC